MKDENRCIDIDEIPVLKEPELYVYVLQNSAGRVKVGKTTNMSQRLQSLSGSNGGGDKIVKCYCSPATYLYALETAMHSKMNRYRIQGTEWFEYKDADKLYLSAVKLLKNLMNSDEYHKLNELRKIMSEKEKLK